MKFLALAWPRLDCWCPSGEWNSWWQISLFFWFSPPNFVLKIHKIFFKITLIYLKGQWQKERERSRASIFWFTLHILTSLGWYQPSQQVGAWSEALICMLGTQGHGIPWCVLIGSWKQRCDSIPGAPVWDAGIPSGALTWHATGFKIGIPLKITFPIWLSFLMAPSFIIFIF